MSEMQRRRKNKKMDLKMEYKDTNVKHAVVITQKHTAWVSDRSKKRSTEISFKRDWI